MLGISTDERYRALNLSPQRQKQRTFEVLIEQLAGLARQRPVLHLYEDLHWADPSTLELLDMVVERARVLPVLVVITHRPQFSTPWSSQAHVTGLPLNRLGRRQGAAMALRVTGGKALPAEILDQILERTDGVPLFLEELTRTMLESGLMIDAGDRYELTGPLPPLAIPANLHDSLMARLDRLAPVKELAQIGAVIGREFFHELLAAVADRPQEQLESGLDQLVASELVFRRGSPPDATYSFKHALVKDAAYQSSLKSRRQQLHARLAHVFEERFPAVVGTQPELLAYHLTEAGLDERAADAWARAGRAALGRSAMREAANSLSRAVGLLRGMPSSPDQRRLQLELLGGLGVALTNTLGPGSSEAQAAHERADQLSQELGDRKGRFRARWNLWRVYNVRAKYDSAVRWATRSWRRPKRTATPIMRCRRAMRCGRRVCSAVIWKRLVTMWTVRWPSTRSAGMERRRSPLAATTPGSALSPTAAMLCFLWAIRSGRWRVTRRASRTRWRSGNRTWSHTPTTMACCCCSSRANSKSSTAAPPCSRGSPTSTGSRYTTPKRASWPHGAPSTRSGITAPPEEIRNFLDRRAAMGTVYIHTYFLMLFADAQQRLGRPDEALAAIKEGLARAEATGEHLCTAELHRLARAPAWLSTPAPAGSPRPLSTPHWPMPVSDRRASSSFGPPAISPGSGPIGASGGMPTTCSHQSTAGSPKASILPT